MLQSPRWSQVAWATASVTAMISILGFSVLRGNISARSGQLPAHCHQPLEALGPQQTGPSLPHREGAPTSCSHCPMEETSCVVPSLGSHPPLLQAPSPPRTSPLCSPLLLSPGGTSPLPPRPHLQPLPLSRSPASLRPSSPSLLCSWTLVSC